MYLAIFIQFFLRFSQFFAHPINLKRLVIFLYFSKTNSYFQGWFYKIPGQFQDKRHFFQNPGVFQEQGQIFPGLCEPCKSMSHLIYHINPQIQFVDICCGDLRGQFLKKMYTQQIAYYIYGSITYLVCRYIFDPGESPNVSRSLWPRLLVSVLARSSSEHISI